MWEKRIEIRWRDLDSSRHVNNAVYLAYLEDARTGWLAETLGPDGDVHGFVLARIAIDYRRELTLDDIAVLAGCRLERVGRSSVTTVEEVRTASGELAAEAEAVLVAWDENKGSSRPLTDAERAALTRRTGCAPRSGA
ncbi:MAG TPA: acyl-CoA thioesterase [Gaiellaceae bacterium]|nr:acyl-CoA thioesterase [Gaiellaceae bacterium]